MVTTRSMFQLAVAVSTRIHAPAPTVWRLLANVDAQRRWNSTLASIDGNIAPGERVSFAVKEAPKQRFSPMVVAYDAPSSMVWRLKVPGLTSDRTYRLTPNQDGSTEFALDEVFRGLLLPIVARTFPDFGAMFERTAADLKAAAEAEARPTT